MARLNTVKAARRPRTEGKSMPKCGKCSREIQVGESYYWWKNRAPGMRSGVKSVRCTDHRPSIAEMTPGRRGQLYQLQEDVGAALDAATTESDVIAAAEQAAEGLRELAQELQDGADNIESGFGHTTYQSEEMADKAQTLESLADDLESDDPHPSGTEWPEDPEGWTDEDVKEYLNNEDVTEEELAEGRAQLHEEKQQEWLDEAREHVSGKLDEAEV